jgi:hypothetical protein
MNVNHLLLWMSARGQGSWIQFKSAIEELHLATSGQDSIQNETVEYDAAPGLPYHQILRLNLESLAHVEFFANETSKGWRVVPPSVALHRQFDGWLGVVCGARSPSILARLEKPMPANVEIHSLAGYPDQILFTAPSYGLILESAGKLDLEVQLDAPAALLLSLPPITHSICRRRIPLPFGKNWKVERFSVSALKWKTSTFEELHRSKGDLFHLSIAYRHHYVFCERANVFEVAPRIGKYLSIARRHYQVIRYDKSAQTMIIPASFRPPLLIERALVLCSGRPASYDSSKNNLLYAHIPQNIACYTSSLLRQEMT